MHVRESFRENKKDEEILDKHLSEQSTEGHAVSLSQTGPSHDADGNAVAGKTVAGHGTGAVIFRPVDAHTSVSGRFVRTY